MKVGCEGGSTGQRPSDGTDNMVYTGMQEKPVGKEAAEVEMNGTMNIK